MLKREIGPLVRKHGFKGSAPNWRLTGPDGDVALINFQSDDPPRDAVRFVINIAIITRPWLDWLESEGRPPGKAPGHGTSGQWSKRVNARPGWLAGTDREGTSDDRFDMPLDSWWTAWTSEHLAAAMKDATTQLRDDAIPTLQHLVVRSNLIDAIEGSIPTSYAPDDDYLTLALLYADDGRVADAEAALAATEAIERRERGVLKASPHRARYRLWIRQRALQRSP